MKKAYSLLVGMSLIFLIAFNFPVNTTSAELVTGKTIVIFRGYNPAHSDYNVFYDNYTAAGNDVILANETNFDLSDLSGVDALFLTGQRDPYGDANVTAIANWFLEGYHLLWVTADSDYGGYFASGTPIANGILRAIGSQLGVDAGAISDPQSNDGASYRVYANETGDGTIASATVPAHFTGMVFHGPTAVTYWNGTGYEDLRNKTLDNVEQIIFSSAAAEALDQDLSYGDTDVYPYINVTGNYPMLVVEKISDSYVIVSGEVVFSDYKNMYGNHTEYNQPSSAKAFIDNLIKYLFDDMGTAPAPTTTTTTTSTTETTTSTTTSETSTTTEENETPGFTFYLSVLGLSFIALVILRKRK